MGDVLSGIFGGGGKETVDNKIDPQSQQLNVLRAQQLSGLFADTPYSSLAAPRPDIYTGSPAVDQLFSTAQQPSGPNDYSNLLSTKSYTDLGLDESRNFISQVATPEILQTAALQGLEGGGFVSEAIAKATAGIALPFLQGLPGASNTFTQARPQAELARASTDVARAQTASTLFPLADYGRGLAQQDLLRQQAAVTTGFTGIPFTPVTDSTNKKSSQPLFNFFGQG